MKKSLSKSKALKKIEKNLIKNNILIPKFFYFTKNLYLSASNYKKYSLDLLYEFICLDIKLGGGLLRHNPITYNRPLFFIL